MQVKLVTTLQENFTAQSYYRSSKGKRKMAMQENECVSFHHKAKKYGLMEIALLYATRLIHALVSRIVKQLHGPKCLRIGILPSGGVAGPRKPATIVAVLYKLVVSR